MESLSPVLFNYIYVCALKLVCNTS